MKSINQLNLVHHIPRLEIGTWPARSGATLSEALIALLVMSIGIVSMASLFPIAVLKTAKANQLTVATGIRYNAEEFTKLYPASLLNPDPWDRNGPKGVPDGNPQEYNLASPFMLDPLALTVGRQLGGPPIGMYGMAGLIPRYDAGFDTIAEADSVFSSSDSWTARFENNVQSLVPNSGPPGGSGGVQIVDINTMGNLVDSASPQNAASPISPEMRVVLFYNGGKGSVTRKVNKVIQPGNTALWTEDVNGNGSLDTGEDYNFNGILDQYPLPSGVNPESARVESKERRYTWLITARPRGYGGGISGSPSFDVDVVVFYGRTFSPSDDQVFGTHSGLAIPSVGTAKFTFGTRFLTVSWPTAATQPLIRRGGYVFDAQNGYWYQIENYTDPAGGSSVITLATSAHSNSSLAIFPRGIVDVFPVGAITP